MTDTFRALYTERVMHFRGVPLIPPLDCTDPQSWIAEQIYQMGAAQAQPQPEPVAPVAPTDEEWDELWDEKAEYFALYAEARRFGRAAYAAGRPKSPSLKEQALARLAELESDEPRYGAGIATIRRALEALPND